MSSNSTDPASTLNSADTAWVLVASCLVFIMIPGLGYFYGGLARKHHKLTLLITSALGVATVSVQWYIWGYSLSFSTSASRFIGNLDNALLMNVGNNPHPLALTIPANVFMIYQGMFAAITPCIAFGSAAERTTLSAYLIFLFVWSTLVYDFIACWTWNPNGWMHDYGVLDFAGGTPVHVSSGFSALAYALAVGPRRTVNFEKTRPSSVGDVFWGTVLLWFGWFGFNGGSELAINSRAVNAAIVTNLAASVAGLTWMFAEMVKHRKRKYSLNGFCCGAVAGLVTITPAAGYVQPHYAIIFGFLGGLVCLYACEIKKLTKFKYDDACDVFAVHGVGGLLGCLLTGLFADKSVVTMAGDSTINGGWLNRNYIQLAYQLMSCTTAGAWAFVITFIILQLIGLIPFIKLKLSEAEEQIGSDWVELGEVADDEDWKKYDQPEYKEILKESKKIKESNFTILKSYFGGSSRVAQPQEREPSVFPISDDPTAPPSSDNDLQVNNISARVQQSESNEPPLVLMAQL